MMAYCNRCREEYEDYVKDCPVCGEEIEKELLSEREYVDRYKIVTDMPDYNDLVSLVEVADNSESEIVISYLDSNGIDAYKHYEGAGSYLHIIHGFNYGGVHIMVSKEQYERAVDVIEQMSLNDQPIPIEEADNDYDLADQRKTKMQNLVRVILLLILFIPIIFVVIYNLSQ